MRHDARKACHVVLRPRESYLQLQHTGMILCDRLHGVGGKQVLAIWECVVCSL
jgi:hypothetical protein